MTYSEAIMKRLQDLCDKRNITVNRLATLSGLSQSTVEYIMNGKSKNPTISSLHKIATGLNMTISELLDFEELNNEDVDT